MSNQCFISHASEDKEIFVRPLAHALKKLGINVWYDEFSLKPGDSLRRSIDKGLVDCDFGIVILSRPFFAKEWPQRELDALLTAEIAGLKTIIPIWHGVDQKYIASVSALLADKVALKSDSGVDATARRLAALLPDTSGVDSNYIAEKLELFLSHETYVLEFLNSSIRQRFLAIQAFNTEMQKQADAYFDSLTTEQIEKQQFEIDKKLQPHRQKLAVLFGLPTEVEVISDEPIPEERMPAWFGAFEQWVSGTLGSDETRVLVFDIETYFEVDYLYLLLGLPNFEVSESQRELLDDAIALVGSWLEVDGSDMVLEVCNRLRKLDIATSNMPTSA